MKLNRTHRQRPATNASLPVPKPMLQHIGILVTTIADECREQLKSQNISIELDLDDFEAPVDPKLIHIIAHNLIENAAASLPTGGEISINLIDGEHQWELEISDSDLPDSFGASLGIGDSKDVIPTRELPVAEPTTASGQLAIAEQAALAHRGEIQVWNCPQGGTAHVFVASRRPVNFEKHNAFDGPNL